MLKFRIGTKIGIGFGLLILISMMLGALAIYNMSNVGRESDLLAHAYVPEVDVANETERSVLEALYQHRGFNYTNDPEQLKRGNDALIRVDKNLIAAQGLAANYPQLVKLKQGLGVFKKALAGYRQQMTKTIDNKLAIVGNRNKLDQAAEILVNNINAFRESQYEAMQREQKADADYGTQAERLRKIILINNILAIGNDIRIANFKAQAMRNQSLLEQVSAKFKSIDDMVAEVRTITHKQFNIDQLNNIVNAADDYKGSMQELAELWRTNDNITAERQRYVADLLKTNRMTASAGISHAKKISDNAANNLAKASWVMVVGLVVALLLGFVIAFVISRMIIAPVKATAEAVSIAARGDFTFRVRKKHLDRQDELGQMLRDVQKMAESLSDTVRGVIYSAGMVSNAANEISSGNQDLSQRTQEQASAIQETASSLEQMTSSVRNNADNSRQANDLARDTAKMAQEGGKAVDRTIEAMAAVTESSRKIADIISVVNEIAFQTNLLALNAAVEAARAGEAGRGFAVVAGEVRNLAGRSAQAAKEIQGLITDSKEKVEQGNELVTNSGTLLGDIINNVQDVADTVAEITAASQEQAQGIDEVNKAVIQMDEVIQRNASLVEEAASSSEEMASAAQDLLLQMGQFRIEQEDEQGPVITPAAYLEVDQAAYATASSTAETVGHHPKPATKPAPKPKTKANPTKQANTKAENDDFFEGVDLDGFEEF